jgi:hypothetical protein
MSARSFTMHMEWAGNHSNQCASGRMVEGLCTTTPETTQQADQERDLQENLGSHGLQFERRSCSRSTLPERPGPLNSWKGKISKKEEVGHSLMMMMMTGNSMPEAICDVKRADWDNETRGKLSPRRCIHSKSFLQGTFIASQLRVFALGSPSPFDLSSPS